MGWGERGRGGNRAPAPGSRIAAVQPLAGGRARATCGADAPLPPVAGHNRSARPLVVALPRQPCALPPAPVARGNSSSMQGRSSWRCPSSLWQHSCRPPHLASLLLLAGLGQGRRSSRRGRYGWRQRRGLGGSGVPAHAEGAAPHPSKDGSTGVEPHQDHPPES